MQDGALQRAAGAVIEARRGCDWSGQWGRSGLQRGGGIAWYRHNCEALRRALAAVLDVLMLA